MASVALFRGLLNSFPKKISAASDALYWADRDDNGKAAVVKFFGLLDTRGAFGRTKPYFSLDGLRNVSQFFQLTFYISDFWLLQVGCKKFQENEGNF